MRFNELYPNATMLNDDWLKNEMGYALDTNLSPSQKDAIYRTYYLNMCSTINRLHFTKPSVEQVEMLLENPKGDKCSCGGLLFTSVKNANERRYWFLLAQYQQLVFDIANGRTAMLRGEDGKWQIAPDALHSLDELGFCQRTYAMKW